MSNADRIEELRSKYEENPRRYFAPLANEYRKAGDLAQAIQICREHLPKQPGHMSGYIVYGQTLFEANNLDEARTVFEQALSLDPENLIALKHLGDIARMNGENGVARRWYARVLDADPRNDDIASQLASLGAPTPVAPIPVVPEPAPAYNPTGGESVGVFATFDPNSLLDIPDDVTGIAGKNEFWTPAQQAPSAAHQHEPLDLDFPESPEPVADEGDFEEGILAPEWPDTTELVARVVTPFRSATPISVPAIPEAAAAFGRESYDSVDATAADAPPADELVDAFLSPETIARAEQRDAPVEFTDSEFTTAEFETNEFSTNEFSANASDFSASEPESVNATSTLETAAVEAVDLDAVAESAVADEHAIAESGVITGDFVMPVASPIESIEQPTQSFLEELASFESQIEEPSVEAVAEPVVEAIAEPIAEATLEAPTATAVEDFTAPAFELAAEKSVASASEFEVESAQSFADIVVADEEDRASEVIEPLPDEDVVWADSVVPNSEESDAVTFDEIANSETAEYAIPEQLNSGAHRAFAAIDESFGEPVAAAASYEFETETVSANETEQGADEANEVSSLFEALPEVTAEIEAVVSEDESGEVVAEVTTTVSADESVEVAAVSPEESFAEVASQLETEKAAPFVTETMAELLVAQGFLPRAIEVYDELVRRRPHDPVLVARLTELRALHDANELAAAELMASESGSTSATPHYNTPLRNTPLYMTPQYNTPAHVTPHFNAPLSATPALVPSFAENDTLSNVSERHASERLQAFRTARERFAELSRRRVARRTPTHATAVSDEAVEGLSSLFGTAVPTTTDELAARALADAFGPVQDSGESLFDPAPTPTPSMPMRSLTPRSTTPIYTPATPDARGDKQGSDRQPAADYSFDRFFPDPAMAGREGQSMQASAPVSGSSQPVNEDLAQFSAWLKGLNNA